MKSLFVFFCFFSLAVYAQEPHIEFDQEHEVKCHQELKQLGCLNANQEEDAACADMRVNQLSSGCQGLHKDKKKWRKTLTGSPAPQQE